MRISYKFTFEANSSKKIEKVISEKLYKPTEYIMAAMEHPEALRRGK